MTSTKVSITFHEIKPNEAVSLLNSLENPNTTSPAEVESKTADAVQEWPQKNENGVLVDSLGLPWAHKINTDSKVCVKKSGEWKLKRNLASEVVDQVRDELRVGMAAHGHAPIEAPAPIETPAPIEAPAPAKPEKQNIIAPDFAGLSVCVSGLLSSGVLTIEQVNGAANSVGLVQFDHLAARPDLVQAVVAKLNEL